MFNHEMFSLRDMRFLLCSRDLDVLRVQRIMGFVYLNYTQMNEVGKSDPTGKMTKFENNPYRQKLFVPLALYFPPNSVIFANFVCCAF